VAIVDELIEFNVETIGTVLAVVAVVVLFKDDIAVVDELDMGDFSSFVGSAAVVVVLLVVVLLLESLFS